MKLPAVLIAFPARHRVNNRMNNHTTLNNYNTVRVNNTLYLQELYIKY